MKKIVILQPQFIPWYGVFEQIEEADIFVHYDDVQFPLGRSFTSRVQIKTSKGTQWLTAPVNKNNGKLILESSYDGSQDWRSNHRRRLELEYKRARFYNEMQMLVKEIYGNEDNNVANFNIFAIECISKYLQLDTKFVRASELGIEGKSSERLLNIMKYLNGDTYITGMGAKNYLDYEIFERESINVRYMEYKCNKYEQLNGDFTPYVTILDAIANVGKETKELLNSKSVYWKDVIYG